MVMDDPHAVHAFDVAHPVLQAPVYRVNALALSRLLPEGGTLLDLGSGSGRLLIDLAAARPDVRLEGRDLAPNMVAAGRRTLTEVNLHDRVKLVLGDMTRVEDPVGDVDESKIHTAARCCDRIRAIPASTAAHPVALTPASREGEQ